MPISAEVLSKMNINGTFSVSYFQYYIILYKLSRSTVAFLGVFMGLERARPGSPLWASLVDFRFLLIGSEPF
jgi:hypothetical protein